ncbi:MAG: quinone oxidoreductase [Alcaligenaceae bacterium]|nr:quinone oxidoreductase [Alcaligenaceae bacterium SAGV5]MPS54889.1 quinone oxidoreductase [Alcaligenaceae bacterium SAGV3]MPT56462.1 quinone oxidoreductase [Alcaligenaceae bacterium]
MRAIRIERFGGPEALRLVQDLPVPEPGPGEVRVRMAYAGVNYTDIYRREGDYAASATYVSRLPLTLGIEGAGCVDALGPGVAGIEPGARVAFTRTLGAWADHAIVPAHRLARVPGGVSLARAAAGMTNAMTAHYLTTEFGLRADDWCLVHAGAGGVGQWLIRRARALGVNVIATAGNEAKARIARDLGAREVILYREADFDAEVRRMTEGRGVDVVFDSVGRDTLARSLRSLRRRGTCVLYGHASGRVDALDPMELAEAGSVFLTRPHMADYIATTQEYARRAGDVMGWLASGADAGSAPHVWPLEQARLAQTALASRATTGKAILAIAPHLDELAPVAVS